MNGRYVFVQHLGSFGFGSITVYLDTQLNRKVVQKALRDPNFENCERLIREGKTYIALANEDNVVDILAHNFNYTNPYLLLPFYEDGTLQNWVGKNVGWYDAIIAIQNAAKGLQAVHAFGGIHRDIKPSNLFIARNDSGKKIIKVGDFGLGRLPRPFTSGDITRHACGTDGYIAPELYSPGAKFTQACDIYSLGITGIELITGSRDRNSINLYWINNEVKQLLLQMTSYDPNHRPDAKTINGTIVRIIKTYDENFKTVVTVAGMGLLGYLLYKSIEK